MSVDVKHTPQSPIPDDGVANIIGPTAWNNGHLVKADGPSVLGIVGTGAAQTVVEITASVDGHILRFSGGAVSFGTLSLGSLPTIPTDTLLGRDTAGTGAPENITLNSTLSFTGSLALQRAALVGDVTASAGANTTAIAANAVTNTQAADMAVNTIKGRKTAGTGDPEDLTPTQVASMFSSDVSGTWVGASGKRWSVFPYVFSDGVMEVGRFIDFHNANAGVTDFDVRLDTNGGTTDLFVNSNIIYRAGGTQIPTGDIAADAVTY